MLYTLLNPNNKRKSKKSKLRIKIGILNKMKPFKRRKRPNMPTGSKLVKFYRKYHFGPFCVKCSKNFPNYKAFFNHIRTEHFNLPEKMIKNNNSSSFTSESAETNTDIKPTITDIQPAKVIFYKIP